MIKGKKILDPDINTHSNLINSSFFTSYHEELKAIQRSITLLRQDLPKIIHNDFVRSKTKGEGF